MRYIEEVELGGKSRYFNLNLFSSIYLDKKINLASSFNYIVFIVLTGVDKHIPMNITPISLDNAKYLQHKFLKFLDNKNVKIISINPLNGGMVYEDVCFN